MLIGGLEYLNPKPLGVHVSVCVRATRHSTSESLTKEHASYRPGLLTNQVADSGSITKKQKVTNGSWFYTPKPQHTHFFDLAFVKQFLPFSGAARCGSVKVL